MKTINQFFKKKEDKKVVVVLDDDENGKGESNYQLIS